MEVPSVQSTAWPLDVTATDNTLSSCTRGAGAWAGVNILAWHSAESWRGDIGGLPGKRMCKRAGKEEVGRWVKTMAERLCMVPNTRWPPLCGRGSGVGA